MTPATPRVRGHAVVFENLILLNCAGEANTAQFPKRWFKGVHAPRFGLRHHDFSFRRDGRYHRPPLPAPHFPTHMRTEHLSVIRPIYP